MSGQAPVNDRSDVRSVGAAVLVPSDDERDALFDSPDELRRSLRKQGLVADEIERELDALRTTVSLDVRWFAVLGDGRRVMTAARHGSSGVHVASAGEVSD